MCTLIGINNERVMGFMFSAIQINIYANWLVRSNTLFLYPIHPYLKRSAFLFHEALKYSAVLYQH